MSSSNNAELNEEQKNFLKLLEEEFKDRYTENDDEFKAVLNEKPTMPPVVENWVNPRHRDDRRGYRDCRDRDWNRERYQNLQHYDTGERYPHSSRYQYRDQKPH